MQEIVLVMLVFLNSQRCESVPFSQSDDYSSIRPLLKQWSQRGSHVRRLTIIYEDHNQDDAYEIPRTLFEEFWVTTRLLTLNHLMNFRGQPIAESGNCVLLLFRNILNIRQILRTPHLNAVWHPRNFYILHESRGSQSRAYKAQQYRFLRWALERLWRTRSLYKLVVVLGDELIKYDPFDEANYEQPFEESGDKRSIEDKRDPRKRLAIYQPNDTRLLDFFREHRSSFQGYPLRISVFNTPTMVKKGRDSYAGLGGKYVEVLCKMLNVTPIFKESQQTYGWLERGVFSGTLGDIVYRRTEVTFNEFFVKDYLSTELEPTVHLTDDKLCMIVPKALPIPAQLLLVRTFTLQAWALILIGHTLISVVCTIMKEEDDPRCPTSRSVECRRVSRGNCKTDDALSDVKAKLLLGLDGDGDVRIVKKDRHFRRSYRSFYQEQSNRLEGARSAAARRSKGTICRIEIVSFAEYLTKVILQLAQPLQLTRPRFPERLFLICSLAMSLILNGIFSSKLTSNFSKLSYLDDLQTLEDVDRTGLVVLTDSPDLLDDALNDDESQTVLNLRAKLELSNATVINRRLFYDKNAAYLNRKKLIPVVMSEREKHLLHVVEECPKQYTVSALVHKGSPFLSRINVILGRLNNGGFYDKWFGEQYPKQKRIIPTDKSVHMKLTMAHVCIPFVILFIGLGTSTIVFICERKQQHT
ncbi:hypothetical protein KM043_010138 [Ampulex compressa]|nr:hypothetical protein KM043_010138 [Ampulex compressa]